MAARSMEQATDCKPRVSIAAYTRRSPVRVIHDIPAIAACPVRPKSGHSADARFYKYAH